MSFRMSSQRIGAALRSQRASLAQTVRRSYASTTGSNLPKGMQEAIEVRRGLRESEWGETDR